MALVIDSELHARVLLLEDFPGVPPRIITAVLQAYTKVLPSVQDALHAAYERLADARAI